MRLRGPSKRRGFAIAAVALCLTAAFPLATAAEAASSSRMALAAKLHRPLTQAGRTKLRAAIRAKARAAAAARARTAPKTSTVYGAQAKPKVGAKNLALRRALARRRLARKSVARRRAPRATALHAKPVAKHKPVPLSLPQLAFFAVAPFVLIGMYLLGSDYLRRRVPRKRKRRASLVITRVSDR